MMDWKGARKQSCHNLRYYPILVSSRVSGKLEKTTVRLNRLSTKLEPANLIMKAKSVILLESSGSLRDLCAIHKPHDYKFPLPTVTTIILHFVSYLTM